LIWDFGALSVVQEEHFIRARLEILQKSLIGKGLIYQMECEGIQMENLAAFVAKAQNFVRDLYGVSSVSQRDIQTNS